VFAFAELEPVRLTSLGSLQVVLVSALLAWVEMLVLKERALIGNLGVSRVAVAAMCAVPAALGETVIVLAGLTA